MDRLDGLMSEIEKIVEEAEAVSEEQRRPLMLKIRLAIREMIHVTDIQKLKLERLLLEIETELTQLEK